MGLATANLVLARIGDREGLHDVRLRITRDRIVKEVNVGISVQPKHWNTKPKETATRGNYLFTGHTAHQQDNLFLRAELARIRQLINDHPTASAEELKQLFRPKVVVKEPEPAAGSTASEAPAAEPDFIEYFTRDLARFQLSGNPRTAAKRLGILRKLKAAVGGEGQPFPFSMLTAEWVRDWKAAYLARKPLGMETINKELEVIRAVVRQAVKDRVIPYDQNPFLYVTLGGRKATPKHVRLNAEQLEQFEAMEIPDKPTAGREREKSWYHLAHDFFMFQLYCQGARAGDVIELRERHVKPDRVTFIERKTKKEKSVLRHPKLDELLAKYPPTGNPDAFVFPLLDHRAAYALPPNPKPEIARQQFVALLKKIESMEVMLNKYLKRLAKAAELPDELAAQLTTHSARHTFADKARVRKLPVKAVQQMLNHSTIAITERYLSDLAQDELDETTMQVYY